MITDKYVWMENLEDPRVLDWALKLDENFRSEFSSLSGRLKSRILKYYAEPYIINVRVSARGLFQLTRSFDRFHIELRLFGGEIVKIADSKNIGRDVVIQNIYCSRSGRRLAYTFSIGGLDVGSTRIVDVDSGEVLDELEGLIYSVTWIDDERFYYVRGYRLEKTPDGVDPPNSRIFLRENGRDELVFGEGVAPMHHMNISSSTDGEKALVTVMYGWSSSRFYGGLLKDPESWNLIYGGDDRLVTPFDCLNNSYYAVDFNLHGNGKVISISNGRVRIVVGERKYPLISALQVDGKLILNYLVNASSQLKIHSLNGRFLEKFRFDIPLTVRSMHSNGDICAFIAESFLLPYRLYMYNSEGLTLLDSNEILGEYSIHEAWTKSWDETPIHMFIVKRKNAKFRRILIYGYGGFRISITPRFSPMIIPFLEDGGVYVVANIRGGLEYGEKWHRDGMREKKQNVFEDFKSAIKYFKERDAKIVPMGRSNGGLLVGAILTQNPELIDGAVIGYPVLDMLRYHVLYGGRAWIPEYGDPDKPEDRVFLLEYSPYHNVKFNVKYPPILIYTGLNDDRVHPAHAFKFAAKLLEAGSKVYLRVERASGHSGASPEVKAEENADILAFIYKILGLKVKVNS